MKAQNLFQELGKGAQVYKPKYDQVGQMFLVTNPHNGYTAIVIAEETEGLYTDDYNRAFKIISTNESEGLEGYKYWREGHHYGIIHDWEVTPL